MAERVVSLTDRLTKAATAKGSITKGVRNAGIAMLGHIPQVRRAIAAQLSELRNR